MDARQSEAKNLFYDLTDAAITAVTFTFVLDIAVAVAVQVFVYEDTLVCTVAVTLGYGYLTC